ncbi:hypothetical protein DN752_04025 [Echinicola strongylocentroti]|uniref:Uncharacterized protein n=2 Tax=Echinicola strongylocentroti TaxID=1795355 RepID=A0A2Z4IFJ9_9BACT|nr:hypothetical protein DN752_04025 [Echinicola strongylocentroti]
MDKLALISPTNKSKGIKLGEDINKALQAFGQPNSVEDYPFETDGEMGKLYIFKGNKLFALHGKLDSYHLFNNSILVGKINGTTFKIGDMIKSTRKEIKNGPPGGPYQITVKESHTFLDFPITAGKDTGRNITFQYSSILPLINGNIKYDGSVHLYFDSTKKLVYIGASVVD